MNTKKLLGAKIRELRKRQKLTQEKLSEMVDINPRQMVRIEMGQSFPAVENLEQIAKSLGVSVATLFNNECFDEGKILREKIVSKLETFDEKALRFIYAVMINL